MPLSLTPGLLLCVREFSQGSFRVCSNFAQAIVTCPAPGEVWRLLLLSLLRTKQKKRAKQVIERALAAVGAAAWERCLIELIANRRTLREILALAQSDVQRCQALYYSLAGRPERSPESFRVCLAPQVDCLEWHLANQEVYGAAMLTSTSLDSLADDRVVTGSEEVERLYHLGCYGAALRLARFVLKLVLPGLGPSHPDVLNLAGNLALLYQKRARYAKASRLFRKVLAAKRRRSGTAGSGFAAILGNYAGLCAELGDFATAARLFRRGMKIDRHSLGRDHPDYATDLHNLGTVYRNLGRFPEAVRLYRRARAIFLRAGKVLEAAESAASLGLAHFEQGRFRAAETYFRNALATKEAVLGKDHLKLASVVQNLALFHKELGRFQLSEDLYLRALALHRAARGDDHPSTAQALNNLAVLYKSWGKRREAEDAYWRAYRSFLAAYGEQHHDVAIALSNLSVLYRSEGDYVNAEKLAMRVHDMLRGPSGTNPILAAASLSNLAFLHHRLGDFASAEAEYRQAAEERRLLLGEDHPSVIQDRINLAGLFAALPARAEEAWTLMAQAQSATDRLLPEILALSSESQRLAYLDSVRQHFHLLLAMVRDSLSDTERAGLVLGVLLRRKAIGLEVLTAQRDLVLASTRTDLRHRVRRLVLLRSQLANKALTGPGPEGIREHEQMLTLWQREREDLEAELIREMPELDLGHRLDQATPEAVAAALPAGSALIEYVRFDDFDFRAVPGRGEQAERQARYLAFFLPAGLPAVVRVFDLGDASRIDTAVGLFRAAIRTSARSESPVPESGRTFEPFEEVAGRSAGGGAELRDLVFEPLLKAEGFPQRLIVAPDGALTMLPFEALPGEEAGSFLGDALAFSYVACGRDVPRFKRPAHSSAVAVVLAAPDFDLGAVADVSSADRLPKGWLEGDRERAGFPFTPLAGALAEGDAVAQALGVTAWSAGGAVKARMLSLASPRVLHLATHGFFLPAQSEPDVGGNSLVDRLVSAGRENSLLRSGLALAGANAWLSRAPTPPEVGTGLLTAEEAGALDLSGTELVVLSACDTGLGVVHSGEGVFGLARSFAIAGARAVVASLWKVPDTATAGLMSAFYGELISGSSPREALRRAQAVVRKSYPLPYYWAAFLAHGDVDRPVYRSDGKGMPSLQATGTGDTAVHDNSGRSASE